MMTSRQLVNGVINGLGIASALFSFQLFAESSVKDDNASLAEDSQRPTVAVVLAGGGAKGAAHIGVLKALEEMQVPVDYITGTSMGAYVGGLYATGMSAAEIESFIYSIDWNKGYRDRVNRSDRRVRDKEYEDRYQLTTDLGLRWGEVRAPKGVVQGQNMLRILRETTGNLPPFDDFDELAIPYRSVATDIIELEEVVLDRGYLVDAMMSSMSVPGALPPYEVDGRMLVDGGVINNMPVDVARAMGADIVIAVDISTDYKGEEEFTTFLTVADQLSNYLVRRSTQHQAQTLTEDDVFLQPDVGQMETTEFDKMPGAYDAGYTAAYQFEDQLRSLALSNAEYQHYIDDKQDVRRQLEYGDNVVIDEIVINNNSHYADELLENRLNLSSGKVLKTGQLEQSIQNLYALDRFELITYRFDEVDDKKQVIVDVNEKSWGPNYVDFRFFLEDDFNTDSQYSVGLSSNFTGLDENGSELRTNLEFGTDKLIEAELYRPLFASQNVYSTFGIAFNNEKRNVPTSGFDDTGLDAADDFIPITYIDLQVEAAVGFQQKLWRTFKFGVRYNDGDSSVSNVTSLSGVEFTRLGAFANMSLDSLDSFSLPTRGVYLNLEFLVSHDDIKGSESDLIEDPTSSDTTQEFSADLIWANSYKRHTLVLNSEVGILENKNSSLPISPQELGGFMNLSGISRNSLIGQNKIFGSLVYRYRWFDNDFGLFTSPFYIGGSVEYGGVWSNPDIKPKDAPLYVAGSIFAGVDSPIGPIMFGYGRTEKSYDSVYLIIGTSYK